MNRLTSVIKTCTASIGSINAKADIFCALRLSSSQLSTLSNQSHTENKPLNLFLYPQSRNSAKVCLVTNSN